MNHRQKEAWRKCIEGRIAEEQGREEDGLRAFEQALEIDPRNEHFRAAHEDALRNVSRDLSQPEEELLARIQKKYAQFAPGVAASGKPARMDGLQELLAELDGRGQNGQAGKYTRGLHC